MKYQSRLPYLVLSVIIGVFATASLHAQHDHDGHEHVDTKHVHDENCTDHNCDHKDHDHAKHEHDKSCADGTCDHEHHKKRVNPEYAAWQKYGIGTTVSYIQGNSEAIKNIRPGQWQIDITMLMKSDVGIVLEVKRSQVGSHNKPIVQTSFVASKVVGPNAMPDSPESNASLTLYNKKTYETALHEYINPASKAKVKRYSNNDVPGALVKVVETFPNGQVNALTLKEFKAVKQKINHHEHKHSHKLDLNDEIKHLQHLKSDLQEQLGKVSELNASIDKAIIKLQALKSHVKSSGKLEIGSKKIEEKDDKHHNHKHGEDCEHGDCGHDH